VSLVRVGFVPLPAGANPGFDHADTYRAGRRMYVAHTGADRVDVIDCRSRTFLRSLSDLPGVAGVLVDDAQDLLFTSDREAARVSVFRCSDETVLGRAQVGPHPNGLAYDRRRRQLYAFNLGEPLGQGCTVSILALDPPTTVAELDLPGRPRWALYNEGEDRVFANIREPASIVVIDPELGAIERSFPVPVAGPHGLWLDSGRLYCAADGGELVVVDPASGDVLARRPLPGVPDVLMHDPDAQRLYVAIGDPGVICSFDTASLVDLETVATEPGAHTAGWDPDGKALYVFCPWSSGAVVFEEHD
jgi:DNA-binding beta-propeller fold protein YncE